MRPARADDVDAIVRFARHAAVGVTTLQPDADHLARRIARSTMAFEHPTARPGGEEYLFVVADTSEIVGCSAMVARVGGHDPFYTYEIQRERHVHTPLAVDRTLQVLRLRRDHKGPSELCGLAVAPGRRGQGLGRLASLGRLMFVASAPERFADRIIAEIRGYQDEHARSPFWDAVGSVFFAPNAFEDLDVMTGLGDKDFIAELMPEHPIYLDLLSDEVRAAVGRPHPESVGAVRLLTEQGFVQSDQVDIFDAGPILACRTGATRIVRDAQRLTVLDVAAHPPGPNCLIAATGTDFTVIADRPDLRPDGVVLSPAVAEALTVETGGAVVVATRSAR